MSDTKYCVMTSEDGTEQFTAPEGYDNANATASRLHAEGRSVVAVVTEEHAEARKSINESGVAKLPTQGAVTFGDLVALVERGKELAMSSGDPVMFVHEESGQSKTFTVKAADLQAQMSEEGSAVSAGGTVWFRGVEY